MAPAAVSPRSPRTPRSRTATGGSEWGRPKKRSWRADQPSGKPNPTPLHLDLNLSALAERQRDAVHFENLKKVESRRNIHFDPKTGRATVLREVRFKPRWYGQNRVDEPTAEFAEPLVVKAIAQDLAAIFKGYPGPVEIVRIRKAAEPGSYTAEREAWLQTLTTNQGERLKKALMDIGVPGAQLSVSIAFGGAAAAQGSSFYVDFATKSWSERRSAKEASDLAKVKAVTQNEIVAFDYQAGKVTVLKDIAWKPRYCGNDKMDNPIAELADTEAAGKVFRDLVEVWKIFQVPASVVADFTEQGKPVDGGSDWIRSLAKNRAVFVQKAMEELGVPPRRLTAQIAGGPQPEEPVEPQRAKSAEPERVSVCAAMEPGTCRVHRLKVKSELAKVVTTHRVEDIPRLEELIAQAQDLELDGQWSRVDPLVTDAAKKLQVLQQRKRRQEAWQLSKDRDTSLAHIKVASRPRAVGSANVGMPLSAR